MREILFRGFHKDENGKEKVYVKGEWIKGYWVEGYLSKSRDMQEKPSLLKYCIDYEDNGVMMSALVIPETVGQYTGLTDKNGKKIFEGDVVKVIDCQIGYVIRECGAYGIAVRPFIDWDYFDSEIDIVTGCNNKPCFCRNDNIISLWELMWNYNQEENNCDIIDIIGNIHSNPELLEV